MIEKIVGFKVGDLLFPTIYEAQIKELSTLLDIASDISENIVKNQEQVINILTMKPTSHAKARKANGATRKPKAKPAPAPADEPSKVQGITVEGSGKYHNK